MKTKELHELTVNELNAKLKELSEELFNLRFRNAIGQLENSAALKNCKKEIASESPILNCEYCQVLNQVVTTLSPSCSLIIFIIDVLPLPQSP